MCELFEEYPLYNEEKLSEKRINDIKAAVLPRVKEEESMKKKSVFKTLSIVITAAAVAATSAVLASAEKPAALPTEQPAALSTEQPAAEQSADSAANQPAADVQTPEAGNDNADEHLVYYVVYPDGTKGELDEDFVK